MMAIRKIRKVKMKFEDEQNKEKVFHLKVVNFDKKKQKALKAYGKELEKDFAGLNETSKKLSTAKEAYVEANEDLADAKRLSESDPTEKTYVLALVEARKKQRKLKKKYEKLQLKEFGSDSDDMGKLNEKIFRKQIELIVLDSAEFLEYVEKESYSIQVIVAELFRLLRGAEKKA